MKRFAFLAALVAIAMTIVSCAGGSSEIKIGATGPITGAAATYGASAKNGFEMALEEFNAAGGVNGKKVTMIFADDKNEAAEAATVFNKLIQQDKVVAIVGGVTSTAALAAMPLAQNAKIPALTPTATNAKVTQVGDYIFRACFIDPFQGTIGAKFAAEDLKAKTAGVIFDLGADYSKGLAETFKTSFEALGGQILAYEGHATGVTDFKAQLTKIVQAKPDVIYIPDFYNDVGLIAKQTRELGYKGPLVGVDGWDSADLPKIAGDSVNNGFFTNHYAKDDTRPEVQDFIKKYTTKYGAAPDALAALGYDGMQIMLSAIKKAGKTDGAAIRDALKATDAALVTGKIKFDENRNPVKSAVIIEMKDGQQVYRTTINP